MDNSHLISPNTITFRLEQNAQRMLRLAVIGLVLLASAYFAPRATLKHIEIVAGIGFGLAALLAYVHWPSLGIVAVVIACLIVPLSIGTGTESGINAGMLCLVLVLGLWFLDMLGRPEARLRPSRVIAPLAALGVAVVLSFAFGTQPQMDFAQTAPLRAQIGGLSIFWLSPLALLLAGHQIRDRRWLAALTWLFIILGATYVVGRLAHVAFVSERLFQSGPINGSLFYTWLAALSFGQAAFNRRLPWSARAALGAVVVAVLYLGFFYNREWNSGWVPPLAAIFVALWFGAPRPAALLTVLGSIGLALNASAISGLLLTDYKQYDILTRSAAWTTLVPLVWVNPLLGLGPANYYWYTPLFPILGWSVKFNSHEQYMDIILQTGFLGLICFFWFVWEIARLGLRLRDRVSPGFDQAYVYAALGGLAGMLVAGLLGDWFLPFVYNIGFEGFRASILGWLFLGGLLAIEGYTVGSSQISDGKGDETTIG